MDKTDYGQIAVLTLDDGERITVELSDVDTDKDELVVAPVSSDGIRVDADTTRAIPIDRVVSYEPIGRAERPSYSDPCRNLRNTFSLRRFALWLMLLLCLIASTLWLILTLALAVPGVPGQVQVLAAVVYTICAMWYTFAQVYKRYGGSLRPYAFSCPAVRSRLFSLALRHLAFLLALIVILMAAAAVKPLPQWLNRNSRNDDLFLLTLSLLCATLFFTEVFTNRRLLKQAHTNSNANEGPDTFVGLVI